MGGSNFEGLKTPANGSRGFPTDTSVLRILDLDILDSSIQNSKTPLSPSLYISPSLPDELMCVEEFCRMDQQFFFV